MINIIRERQFKKAFRRMGGKAAGGTSSFSRLACATIEEGVNLGHVHIAAPELSIGAHSYIRSGTELSVVSEIGRFCSIGSNCTIGQEKHTHPSDWVSTHPFQYEDGDLSYTPQVSWARIGHDVWLGHGATVLEGVRVGTGAIIATKAMVTRDVPPYAIVAGNPAKIVKYRHNEDIIRRLLSSEWWNLSVEYLKSLPFNNPAEFLSTIENSTGSLPRATYSVLRVSNKKVQ